MGKTPKKKNGPKAVSIWANNKDRALYKRVTKRSGEALSKIVRVLVRSYDAAGKAPGLPDLSPPKARIKHVNPTPP